MVGSTTRFTGIAETLARRVEQINVLVGPLGCGHGKE
jgi:hypothetical protein